MILLVALEIRELKANLNVRKQAKKETVLASIQRIKIIGNMAMKCELL